MSGMMQDVGSQGIDGYRRPSATEQLKAKKARLEGDLKKVNAALDAFEKHPEMQVAIDAVFEAL